MKPIEFAGSNVIFAKDQPSYLPLPAHKTEDGVVTCCWLLSWRERFKALLNGKIYHRMLTFNQPLQPQKLSLDNPID